MYLLDKIKNGTLVLIGYLLSPLCWWNDLIFNLPIAYGFGRLIACLHADFFLPAAMVGYWLSNLVGILLMQFGTKELIGGEKKERNWPKELRNGLLSSTAYTLVILVLIHFQVLEMPLLSSIATFSP
ncbi:MULTISPECIES: hypothetical protein [unclassified Microcystis]|uniref:hypothetical protein n=1 Tax=unclassified Microcystis TaxID=2643300 RepID=UPI0022CCB092|nr:hypothetical protein [Microcystis sp. LE19-195.1E]MCZ8247300.1 hypothetical protein [Microcystis sp. LE19-195.1E]